MRAIPKIVISQAPTLGSLLQGVKKLETAVGATLGPFGRNVLFQDSTGPVITKDGVTVADQISLTDEAEDLAAQVIQDAARKSARSSGDGTTTTTVLAANIFENCVTCYTADSSVDLMGIKRGIDAAVEETVKRLDKYKLPITQELMDDVARISTNDDKEISSIISKAFSTLDPSTFISVQRSKTADSYLEESEGVLVHRGSLSPYFLRDQPARELKNCYILLVNGRVGKHEPILDLIRELKLHQDDTSSLLVVADSVEGEALTALAGNASKINLAAIKTPGVGENHIEYLWDLAHVTGAKVVGDETGHKYTKGLSSVVLGKVARVILTRETCTFVPDADSSAVVERVSLLRDILEKTTNPLEAQNITKRLTSLTTGVRSLFIGAQTEAEYKEKFFRVEDALGACRVAIKNGVLPGGGVPLAKISKELRPSDKLSSAELLGYEAVRKALSSPLERIWSNAGAVIPEDMFSVGSKVMKNLKSTYDLRTSRVGDSTKLGVIDPFDVTKQAILSAGSAAGLLITTACILVIDRKAVKELQ